MLERDQSSIDISIPYIEHRIAAFKQNLAKYTTMNQEELMKRRDLYVQEIESLRVEKGQVTQDIQNARLKEISLAKLLEEERLERKQAEELVAHNNRQLKSMEERLTEKDRESKRLDATLENLKKSKEKEKRTLDKQATQLARDVIDLERMLGLAMRGAGITWTLETLNESSTSSLTCQDTSTKVYMGGPKITSTTLCEVARWVDGGFKMMNEHIEI
ncbi:9800_t:CDS:2 [Acaulospora colombiana]|uniref:9800_t:CDS:1 n=1 Tax=Acaulospora colombiana TaxID=27376 RepID=A0ACA9NZQ1_9GLOM|nr:9800_t:CDS:2 [Acaulospora colombiana]